MMAGDGAFALYANISTMFTPTANRSCAVLMPYHHDGINYTAPDRLQR